MISTENFYTNIETKQAKIDNEHSNKPEDNLYSGLFYLKFIRTILFAPAAIAVV